MAYFNYATGLTMCVDQAWERLFDLPKRPQESELTQAYMDMALAIQQVTEEVVFRLARTAKDLTGKLLKQGIFKDIWIQPAAGDAGGALGAALSAWHIWRGQDRAPKVRDAMQGAYLGPEFCQTDIKRVAARHHAPFTYYQDFSELCEKVCALLAKGQVVGWFQGRMEYGPRALGNRSILGDPRNRPFAPSIQEEALGQYFDLDRPSPYMLLVAPVRAERCKSLPQGYDQLGMWDRLYVERSDLPAITHVDFSARIQSVSQDVNPRYWTLIDTFRRTQGCPVVVNTSFNVRGEPIVGTPDDAYRCFMRTEMDHLVLGDCLFDKANQPAMPETSDWRQEYALD